MPTPQSKDAETIAGLRSEVVRLNREMRAVSAQDDFARWARLRRDHDKMKEKYDKACTSALLSYQTSSCQCPRTHTLCTASSTQSFRKTFDRIISALRWIGTQGLNFLLNTWLAKQALFWLPQGWVPYHVEWILSFPRAPVGSVSVNMWAIACASIIGMVSEAVRASWALQSGRVVEGTNKGEKVKMGALGTVDKKEL